MRRKLKLLLKIFLLLIITCACIALGFKSRYDNGIVITQFEPQLTRSMGYMLESKENKIIMIDGGLPEDAKHVEEAILNKGGIVEAWFVTHAHDDHVGALIEIIEAGKVQINNIYVSLNSEEWYATYENDARKEFAQKFLETLDKEEIRDKVQEVSLRQEFTIDNLNFKILKVKSPEYTRENAGNNQSMIIKVSNNFKDILFLADLGEEIEEEFLKNNYDEIKSYSVQVSHHGQAGVTRKIYEAIDPTICFWPTPEWLWNNDPGDGSSNGPWKTLETRLWMGEIGVEENYVAKDGDITVRIW